MKLSKEQFRQYILSEIKKIATKEGWLEDENIASESEVIAEQEHVCDCGCDGECSRKSHSDKKSAEKDFEEVIPEAEEKEIEAKEELIKEEEKSQPEDAKNLAEEVKRMKQLLDFRSPLLGEK